MKDFAVVLKEQKSSTLLMCVRNSDTISRKRQSDRENPGGIYRPVEQPHGQLSIGNGSSKMAENVGWLLKENRSLRK